ncbi:hypothetical protein [Pseudogemmobacter blasticus]|uniref:DUF304 domain-containing protein n=1 Tax=Fuscovulum blasticum DSM 2131 TaxID=1188250 RepID=A0A2T4J7S1_FUSBL|nr:hypothetical protein [Fuscovulum blasticum]AWD22661.1 hypothetical protein B6K69_14090 [Fuscovulum blasticum]PTE13950.1 hypothetical protein C5F44_11565 [Fuscovulum blasticum DSM 2131]
MARIEPDSIVAREADLGADETVLEEFRADRTTYWRQHLVLAAVLGVAAGLLLMWQGNPYPVAGPLGAILAIGARAAYLASEALSDRWRLTKTRLIGPGGRILPLSSIQTVRPILGAVQVITRSGDKHLIKYLADPDAVADRIARARS